MKPSRTRLVRRRDFLYRAGGVGLVAVTGPVLLSACSRSENGEEGPLTLERLQEQGYIRAGIANEQPYGFVDDAGELTGESPELAKAIFAELGIDEVRADPVAWDGLIPGLTSDRFDFVAAGMSIIPDRCSEVAFSNPEYQGQTAFMVPVGNPEGIETFEDVAGNSDITLCVLNAAVEQTFAEELGVPSGQLEAVDDQVTAFEFLESGRVDAIALTNISLNWMLQEREAEDEFEVTDGYTPVIDGEEQIGAGGFAFRQEDTEIVEAVNGVLADFQESGRLLEIIEPFGFTEDNLPGDLTVDDLC
ncbi:ectoine/hydroxyectoine ABC transporter substrate-binding protein EhuB [Spiractinospora alimapuensis]|uniref:ectoine/hydroxyectoine ABC transporter substrate-binding protein EhuB n=1 Tax=Spiractinospora alimapuensis TaxID=2820884 RepID=UPI001EEAD48D|nr:ectoine/hydroxyectoine ABC transporter substrate-binding protein EhuB [Spiractinospora alimapuensis]QVQ50700.1 ectoine/hydroxyectoine ABC transporter substrate-binding protein EhuB [Spiractinospora alimapuensis]